MEIELSLEPRLLPPQNIRALLLGRMGGLFLNIRLARSRKVQTVPTDTAIPASFRSRSCISAIVMSGSPSSPPPLRDRGLAYLSPIVNPAPESRR